MRTDSVTNRIYVPTTTIREGSRVRADYGNLEELAESIRSQGLIHPIVVDLSYNLVAGGRRYRAMRDVLKLGEVPVTYIEVADEATLRRLEAEENVRRKDMTWQEVVKSIKIVHQHQTVNSAISGSTWTQSMTGGLIGKSQAHVSYALLIAGLLEAGDLEITKAAGFSDAIKILIGRKENEANASLARATIPSGNGSSLPENRQRVQDILSQDAAGSVGFFSEGPVVGLAQRPDQVELPRDVTLPMLDVRLSSMLYLGDAIDFMAKHVEGFDHVVCDPPYGIEMTNIQQDGGGMNVTATAAEHDVDDNLSLLKKFFRVAYDSLRAKGFCITWCDVDNWEQLKQWAELAGFTVQRWPVYWVKTHPCQNMAAQYNFTKNVEVAMVCRKGNATLVTPQTSCFWQGGIGTEKEQLGHPFAKPANLWKWLFGAVAIKGQSVLDPFAGSGSSTLAALSLGLCPTAVECNADHYNRLVVNVSNYYRVLNPNTTFS